ncbi:cytoskeleton protein RodZ [Photorhabdus laumondii subsp. laumondii]|uniref:Photorhabdus luminescens subsp. laumondii TTO1 complete genome segment 5/17 n=2 Tax=Photorhabdus laumondii subsp. laumondii TaxID=141679 RepID=Q7N707_PHOLL|nr:MULTISPECIES: cytoskeleton protein RodZ [Photorhabdus]AWK44475.1 cytoskeletal protein RodZ [Photorhabdus laumondii subsp. laumondii]AXG45203.1 cytoskeleton protein RodZ [Photorhabdus laumondii subsp. laumondii]AXG49794.1 cytoskeleton protein RodZ [Photorhabdus laumondii subsp. laumondii]KTL61510.1 cytoskeletal protein RodZ [Photorhabdus laumondii subsp. laumondii]MCC8383520.1 cytoskeleton protein RodZ [Photorhabdus laumondii]
MNTETTPEQAYLTAGQLLRQAREQHGLTQQTVADRLCLKLSTIRDIEEDNIPATMVPTFLRGYVRSYAKLVQIPEAEILAILDKHTPAKTAKVSPMQSFSLGKKRKKRESWLMWITWLIILVVISLTGAWWWQNHIAQQKELISMADHSAAKIAQKKASSEDLPTENHDQVTQLPTREQATSEPSPSVAVAENIAENAVAANNTSSHHQEVAQSVASTQNQAVKTPETQLAGNGPQAQTAPLSANQGTAQVPSVSENNSTTVADSNKLMMNFKASCWLQVVDANGKKLFSGTKHKGDHLSLSGSLPYELTIGAPAVVDVQFRGQVVDLSRFIKESRIARLKVPTAQ